MNQNWWISIKKQLTLNNMGLKCTGQNAFSLIKVQYVLLYVKQQISPGMWLVEKETYCARMTFLLLAYALCHQLSKPAGVRTTDKHGIWEAQRSKAWDGQLRGGRQETFALQSVPLPAHVWSTCRKVSTLAGTKRTVNTPAACYLYDHFLNLPFVSYFSTLCCI